MKILMAYYSASVLYRLYSDFFKGKGCGIIKVTLKEKKPQSKCMFRLGDDDIESPYKKILDTFDFFV